MKVPVRLLCILLMVFSVATANQLPAQTSKGKKPASADTKPSAPEIAYTVSMTKPWTHLLEVEMRVSSAQMPEKLDLSLPVWTPGSYLIREYAKHVQDFSAKDGSGAALTWQKTNKNTWQIDAAEKKDVIVRYNVYANELTVRTNELNSEHAFFNNGALLMNVRGWLSAPSTVKINPYGNWKVATGLKKLEGKENTFRADNFDILYDSPFEVSDFKEITFTVQGKPHRFVFCGDGNYNLERVAADTAKIVEEAYKIFGEFGYDDYTFIVNLRGGGGLEHLNSTALQFSKFGFTARYTDFLALVAHEYFHNYNVKRIRPDALGPFDYDNENYTKLLWMAEGGTSYFESVLMRRAGLITDREFLAGKASQIQALQDRPGRFQQSVEESSFDSWIKYYRPDENAVNNQISYYDKGEIVAFMLDMEIRRSSGGAKSLDDVLRHLYNEFFKKGRNYSPTDLKKAAETMAGRSLDEFFSKYVSGREELDYNSILKNFGLELLTKSLNTREQPYLGAMTGMQGERLTVSMVVAGSPAWEQGVNTGDQILALDGNRVTQQNFQSFIAAKQPGDKVKLTIFRFDELMELEITLGGRVNPDYRFNKLNELTEEQKKLYKDYLKADLR